MSTSFSRNLSLLRKEKGVSQKSVASQLKISQALLSHYENGIREPGLEFVVAAADFYGVSADFLLGRTMSRDGTAINVMDLHDASEDKDNILRGSAMSLFSKKILVNTIGIIFDLLGRMENRSLVQHAYSYIGTAVYKIFRLIYMSYGKTPDEYFGVQNVSFSDAADGNMKLNEARFKSNLHKQKDGLSLSNDSMTRDYPLLIQSMMSLIHAIEKDINSQL